MKQRVMKIDRILVPVDFSPASRLALRWGIVLARDFGASLMLMHVVEAGSALDRVLGSVSLMARREQEEEAARLMPALLSERHRLELRPRFLVETGAVADRLLAACRREKADLMIMGTHGRSLIHRALMGSVTQDVLSATDIPVLTIGQSRAEQAIGRVLLATKLTPGSGDVARFAESLAHRLSARLVAFHAVDVGVEDGAEESTYLGQTRVAEAQSALDHLFDQARNTVLETRMAEGSVPASILKSADEHRADLIVVGARRGKADGPFPLGSIGDKIIRDAAVPVLSVPIRAVSRLKQDA
jgi:nucleotide-binding universal stress UspA family protein